MTVVVLLALALLALAAVLAWVAIAQPGPLWRKAVALLALALFVPAAIFGVHELLGRPKPAALEWVHDFRDGATVVGYRLREGEAIYLWVVFEGETAPRGYALPWSLATAKQLEDVHEAALQTKTDVVVELAEDANDYGQELRFTFHAVTPKALPAKPAPEDEAVLYEPGDDQ